MNTQSVLVSQDRTPHWIKLNHQTRMPKRWIAFDTEARSVRNGDEEIQTWSMGAAIRWRTDLKTGHHAEAQTFDSALSLWQWVSSHCRSGMRTVAFAHNLGYDIRISQALTILPQLGFTLEWCNLDSNVSSMTWRSDHGTLVLADTWTWLPLDLATIAPSVGLRKLQMPPDNAKHARWERYCMRDAEIVYRCVTELNDYIAREQLGNWQPTGAGMAYATWRHKFMDTKVLVHDDVPALTAERAAMHTGRAEAWRHGTVLGDTWTEVDMRNAYTTIAAECELPVKLKIHVGRITNAQYQRLRTTYALLAQVEVTTNLPVVPTQVNNRTLWPTGTFKTWLWDTEVNALLDSGGSGKILQAYCYTRGPILAEWARWVLSILRLNDSDISPVVQTWLKHCARALIGRISLRCPTWELFGENPMGITGITHETDIESGQTARMMHIGNRTFIETERREGRDSLPQVTGWIMAECRARLWRAMSDAGLSELAHVDTDSLIVSRAGYDALRAAQALSWGDHWTTKATYRRMIVYGPRNYRGDGVRKVAGVPRKATELLPNVFEGERWHGLSRDLESDRSGAVTVETSRWQVNKTDPRRLSASGVSTATVAYYVEGTSVAASSSSPKSGLGA